MLKLEDTFSKQELFALYANMNYYGDSYFDIHEAARGYYHKEPSQLSLAQSAMLAGIPNAPAVYQLSDGYELAKQRQEAADIYKNSGREDLAAEELAQLKVITQFLPAQMSKEEITAALKQLIADNNISGIKEMGKLMGLASKQFAGKADNKLVSGIVKQLLS